MTLPEAILFDLDDTLISSYRNADTAWLDIATEFAADLGPHDPAAVGQAIATHARRQFSDPEHRRLWRLDPVPTRRATVSTALGHLPMSAETTDLLADRYESYRRERMHLLPHALYVLDALRARRIPLGLVTNGSAAVQRDKIARFDLERRFDHIQIEGETGFGKPDPRAFEATLAALKVAPAQALMIGDDLDFDIHAATAMGLDTVWVRPASEAYLAPNQPGAASLDELLPMILG